MGDGMIKTILWDIDDTLLDFKTAESNSLKNSFAHFGLGTCTDEMVRAYSLLNQSKWELLERGELTKEQVLKERFTNFFALMKITSVDEDEFCTFYENGLSDKIVFMENAPDILKNLKEKCRQYAVTNGAFSIQIKRIEKSGLNQLLDGSFISDDIGFEKPSREFFEYVIHNIEPCRRDEIMIVGDSLTSDMQGGNNGKIKCCWYNPGNKLKDKNVKLDYEIQSLEQIKDIIKKEVI